MRINESTTLAGDKVVLKPYRRSHVPQYHEWMRDPAVREATASEELSLEQEYEMQASWRIDDDKLTFIIHRRDPSVDPHSPTFLAAHDNSSMIGDVNIFLSSETPPSSDAEDEEPAAAVPSSLSTSPSTIIKPPPAADTRRAEVEIMLAPLPARRQGFALSTLRLFLLYASRTLNLPPSAFFARIGTANTGSIALFEKLGFKKGKVVEVFQELEMNWGGKEGEGFGWEGKEEYVPLDDPAEELQQPEAQS